MRKTGLLGIAVAAIAVGVCAGNLDDWSDAAHFQPVGHDMAAVAVPEEHALRIWDGTEAVEAPGEYRYTFASPLDLRDAALIGFEMRGRGERKALKLTLIDAAGIPRMYGPFWAASTDWSRFEFAPAVATWNDARDAEFDLGKVVSVTLVPEPKMGKVELRGFAEQPFGIAFDGQWRTGTMDPQGFVVVGGKRFFPIGLYSLLGENQASAELLFRKSGWENTPENRRRMFEEMRDSGFNTIQSYTSPQYSGTTPEARREGAKAFLDMAQKSGLKVMLTVYGLSAVPLTGSAAEREQEQQRRDAELTELIGAVHDHPALLGYYLADEPLPSGTSRAQLERAYRLLKELDSEHPSIIVECSDPGFTLYRRAADIMAFDPYPVDKNGPANIADVSRAIRVSQAARVGSHPATWAVLQLHRYGERLPTEQEMRAMVMQALALDVRGLFFFAMTYPDAEGPLFLSHPEHWAAVKRVTAEINALEDFCTSDRVTSVTCDRPGVETLAKQVGDDAYALVAVYPGNGKTALSEVTATFAGLPAHVTEVRVFDGMETAARTIPVVDGAFSDRFTENAAHVYRWEVAK